MPPPRDGLGQEIRRVVIRMISHMLVCCVRLGVERSRVWLALGRDLSPGRMLRGLNPTIQQGTRCGVNMIPSRDGCYGDHSHVAREIGDKRYQTAETFVVRTVLDQRGYGASRESTDFSSSSSSTRTNRGFGNELHYNYAPKSWLARVECSGSFTDLHGHATERKTKLPPGIVE